MLVSINAALGSLDKRFQHVDFDGIQRIVDTFSDPKARDAVKADPHNYMIKEMKKYNVPIPLVCIFIVDRAQPWFLPKPMMSLLLLRPLCLRPHQSLLSSNFSKLAELRLRHEWGLARCAAAVTSA